MRRIHRSSPPLLFAAALAVSLFLNTPSPAAGKEETKPLPPDVTLTTLDGDTVTLGELRGKAVLLDFWATWCKPCHASLPTLRRLHQRIEKKELPVVLLSVSVDHNREALERFVEEEGMEWLQTWDREARFTDGIGINSFPFFLMLDHEGRPVSSVRGWGSRHDTTLSRMVMREAKRARKAERRAADGSTR